MVPIMEIQYYAIITGQNIIAKQKEEDSDFVTLIDPYHIFLEKTGVYYQYNAFRWDMYLEERDVHEIKIQKNHILFSGVPHKTMTDVYLKTLAFDEKAKEEMEQVEKMEKVIEEAEKSSKEENKTETSVDEALESYDEIVEMLEKIHSEYLKKVH